MDQAKHNATPAEHRTGFFQRKSVQTILPFATSLALHGGLVAFGLAVFKTIEHIRVVRQEIAMPIDTNFQQLDPTLPISWKEFKGIGPETGRDPGQPFDMDNVDPNSLKFKPGSAEKVNINPGGGEGDNGDTNDLIGGTGAFRGNGGKPGSGFGPGEGPGSGEAHRGPFGPYGPPGGDSIVFRKPNARKIVYVCDATGSMTPVFSGLKRELEKAVGSLAGTQFFNVIFFSDDKVLSLSPSLVMADPAGKAKSVAFVNDVTSRGLTNPLPAIRKAFEQKPDVMFVLTDGFDQIESLQAVIDEFDKLNTDRKVIVNTILLGTSEQKELADTLKKIAENNRGTMSIVSKEDF